jgi:hypothetical protein
MGGVRRPWSRISQVLMSLKWRTGQTHKLQNSSKASLREKERIGTAKEKALSPGQVAQSTDLLFRGQFINFKGKWQEKSEQSLQKGLG